MKHPYLPLVAAALAVTLAMSTVPAQAVSHHPGPQPVALPSAGYDHIASNGPFNICFYRSYDYCQGANVNPEVAIILGHIEDLGWQVLAGLIIYWIIKKSGGGGSSTELAVRGYDPKNPRHWVTNECIGVWGYNNHPHLGSCSSRHGVYWWFTNCNSARTACRLWNTYSRGWLTTGVHLDNKEALWVTRSVTGKWHTWAAYTPRR